MMANCDVITLTLIIINLIRTTYASHEEVTVSLGDFGSIKGLKVKSSTSNVGISDYVAFYGIPYAQPPIGSLRFRPPKVLENIIGKERIFDATDAVATSKARCPQMSWATPLGLSKFSPVIGQEDCLTINIHAPINFMGKMTRLTHFIDRCEINIMICLC